MSDARLLDRALTAARARRRAAREKGIELIGVFGSVARGEEGEKSDVDFAYDIVGRASLLDLGGLLMDLRRDLSRKVDLVDISEAKPSLREAIERDLVRL
ncbi:MAG: nucleotidyltransferase family protein [Caulobacteraceae bacterium]